MELSDAGREERLEKMRKRKEKLHEEMEARWRGVPFTTRKLSFSSTANRHIRNEQECVTRFLLCSWYHGIVTSGLPLRLRLVMLAFCRWQVRARH